jgi:dolichol kinase
MKKINIFELRRGIFHALCGLFLVFMILLVPYTRAVLLSLIFIGTLVIMISKKIKIPGISNVIKLFERKEEKYPGITAIFYMISAFLTLQFFKQDIAMASIIILAIGDPMAGFVGRNFGKIKIFRQKHLEGTLAGFIASGLLACIFVPWNIAFFGAGVGMIVELFSVPIFFNKKIDDNLTIPIISGLAMYLASII